MENILIISNENNIIHILNRGYSIDYTIYNSKGHSLDGGILESSNEKFNDDFAIKEVITIVKENYSFSNPYSILKGERANNLLELIEMEDYKNMKTAVENKEFNDIEITI